MILVILSDSDAGLRKCVYILHKNRSIQIHILDVNYLKMSLIAEYFLTANNQRMPNILAHCDDLITKIESKIAEFESRRAMLEDGSSRFGKLLKKLKR